MDKTELAAKLAAHREWLADNECGEKLCLSGAGLGGADLSGSDLRFADFSGAYLRGADLRGANLSGAVLGDANLSDSDLSEACLGDANLRGASLYSTDLSGANLSGASLNGADLRGVILREATGFVLLPVQDLRGYCFAHAILCDDGWRVRVGCRDFTIDEALEHWGDDYKGDREQGDMYLLAVNWLKAKVENER